MKKFAIVFALLALASLPAVAADSPFAGTWKLNPEKSKFTGDTFTYTRTASGYHFSNGSTIEYDFAVDGKDYPTIADRTVTWTAAGPNAWDTEAKANGKMLSKSHRVLSADGKTLSSTFTEYRPDGTEVTESDSYTRVSGGSGLDGKWKDVKVKAASDSMTITVPMDGQVEMIYPNYQEKIAGPTDGTPIAIKGPTVPDGVAMTIKPDSASEWVYSISYNGMVLNQGKQTVSGKVLTDVSWIPGKESEKATAIYEKQ